MTVYIEYVIIDNLVINYLILKTTFAIMGRTCKRKWLFLSSAMGTIVALVYPLLSVHQAFIVAIKILTGLLMVQAAGKVNNFRQYYLLALLFFLITFCIGGAILGIYSMFGIDYSSEISIAIMILPVYLIAKLVREIIKYVYKRKDTVKYLYDVALSKNQTKIKLKGFMDTGNSVYDGDRPVIFCQRSTFIKLYGINPVQTGLKKITINTISGQTEKIAFELDQLEIYIGEKVNIHNNVTVCVTRFNAGEYEVLLHPALLGGEYEQTDIEIKKIS